MQKFDVNDVVCKCKENVFFTFDAKGKIFIKYKNETLQIISYHYNAVLSFEEFENIFKHNIFYVYDIKKEEIVDESKDGLYYSWRK